MYNATKYKISKAIGFIIALFSSLLSIQILSNISLIGLRVSDLLWLNEPRGINSLFYYLISFINLFVNSRIDALLYSSVISLTLIPLSIYLFLFLIFRRVGLALVGSILIAIYSGYISIPNESAYGSAFALFFLFLTLSAYKLIHDPRPEGLALLVLGVMLCSFSDPRVGSALFLALLIYSMMIRPKSREIIIMNIINLLTLIISYAIMPSTPTMSWENESAWVLSLSAACIVLSSRKLYRDERDSSKMLLSLGLSSALSTIIFGYPIVSYAIIITASAILLTLDGFISAKRSDGDSYLEIDIIKLGALLLLALVIMANASNSISYSQVQSRSLLSIEQKYGRSSLIDALNWIKDNTPQNSLILAEYPLASWIKSLANRAVMTNYKIQGANLSVAYDADTILNATYEMRNDYIRVRDWAPVAPQRSPVFAVSNGTAYIDFLYIDENHLHVILKNGSYANKNYESIRSTFNGFIDSSGKEILEHDYQLDGIGLTRLVSIGMSENITVSYIMNSSNSMDISGITFKLWVPWDRLIGFSKVSGNRFDIDMDTGSFTIYFIGPLKSLEFGPDETWGQPRLLVSFSSADKITNATFVIDAKDAKQMSWSNGLVHVSDKELLSKYRVAYAVIPIEVKRRLLDRFGYYFPTYTSVFENDKLTIYKVNLG